MAPGAGIARPVLAVDVPGPDIPAPAAVARNPNPATPVPRAEGDGAADHIMDSGADDDAEVAPNIGAAPSASDIGVVAAATALHRSCRRHSPASLTGTDTGVGARSAEEIEREKEMAELAESSTVAMEEEEEDLLPVINREHVQKARPPI